MGGVGDVWRLTTTARCERASTGKDCDVVTAAAYPMSGDITDVCWGETAPGAAMALFVVAGGVVQIMAGKSADGFYAVSQFDDSDPINTVLPLHCDATAITLVCAARGARYISMWKYVPATALASCVQTVSLSCGSDASFSMCRTVSHPTTSHDSALVVATVSAATPVIAVLTADPESSRLTHATTFDVPSRVLSFVSTRPVVGPSGTVQLFCVQPSAVQRYTIPHAAYVASAALSLISEVRSSRVVAVLACGVGCALCLLGYTCCPVLALRLPCACPLFAPSPGVRSELSSPF